MYRKRRAGSGKKGKLLAVLAVIVIAAVYYYVAIPAVNIHSSGFWMFLIALVVLGLLFYGGRKGIHSKEEVKSSKILKLGIGLVVVLVLVYFAGSISVFTDCQCKKIPEPDGSGNRKFCRGY